MRLLQWFYRPAQNRVAYGLLLCVLCGIALVNCGSDDERDFKEEHFAWVQNGIACYYYDPKNKTDFGQKKIGSNFVYAKTPADFKIGNSKWGNYEVWPKGETQDGFYVMKGIRVQSFFGRYTDIPVNKEEGGGETLQRKLEEICLQTVKKNNPNNPNNVVHDIVITKNLSRSRLPIVFPSQETNLNKSRISRIVVFGDSLSDTGNLRRKLGWTGFLGPPYWLGRFSNGPNWVDYLSKRLNLAVLNFATGGAVAAKINDVPTRNFKAYVEIGGQLIISGSTTDQVNRYISSLSRKKVKSPDNTLYVLAIGANDYVSKMANLETLNVFIQNSSVLEFQPCESIKGRQSIPGSCEWTVGQTTTFIKKQMSLSHTSSSKRPVPSWGGRSRLS